MLHALIAVSASLTDDGYLTGIAFGYTGSAAANSPALVMNKVMMHDKGLKTFGAVCLDGTDAGFYYAPAADASKHSSWQLYFEGGGWCYDEMDCWGRSNGDLGSSTNWPETVGAGGMLSDNCTVNPDFCNFHRVYMKYCDGDSFSGNRNDAVVVKGKPLYFRGHRILQAVLATLVSDYGLSSATEVLLTGCSAGGLATFLHADYVHNQLRSVAPKLVKYKAAPISGFFLDHDTVEGKDVYATQMAYIFHLANASGGVNSECIATTPAKEAWKCNFAEKAYEFTSSPIMPLNSALDSWQTGCIYTAELPPSFPNQTGTVNGMCSKVPGWGGCAGYSGGCESCTASQIDALNLYIRDFESIISHKATYLRPGNGAFVHSCHTHCEAQDSTAYSQFKVNGVSIQQAVSKWWAGDGTAPASENSYDSCEYKTTAPHKCNPTCY